MDSLINAAARCLARGDALGALKLVALRKDPPGLALRAIAMAQLGELARAKELLRAAMRGFSPKETVARARCVVAEAEIALALRDLGRPMRALGAARVMLERHGDWINAAHARYLEVRRLLLIGRLEQAESLLEQLDPSALPPASQAVHQLMVAGIALRRLRVQSAREAIAQAARAAHQAQIGALTLEVAAASQLLEAPAARVIARGTERLIALDEVEALLSSKAMIVDACRHVVRDDRAVVPLARRPVLLTLVRALGEAWPEDLSRDTLVARAFRAKVADESHRARLRVEVGRLRAVLRPIARLQATPQGFRLVPHHACEVIVLARPAEEASPSVLALLADGESWSSSALALAARASQRTVQRELDSLAERGKVQSFGQGRSRRWMLPSIPGFATTLLLPAPLPIA